MSEYQPIIKKRIGFLAAAALGLSALLITTVICCTVTVVYGLHVVSDRADGLVCLAERTVRSLPDMAGTLPPALGDLVNDQRRPDYAAQIEVTGRMFHDSPDEPGRIVVEAANRGNEMVTLLSLRVTAVNADGRIVYESNEWAATPFAADHPWTGPLMANGVRRFNASRRFAPGPNTNDLKVEVEITDIRVWKHPQPKTPQTPAPAQALTTNAHVSHGHTSPGK